MSIRAPHFLLMSETGKAEQPNQWRFVLASADGQQQLVASDAEPEVSGERLELLSVVRGLEALEQPSQVTLLTDSRYVSQGISAGLNEWRDNDWCWERFGELTPVKNLDLWRRVDQALRFHRVDCRTWRFDPPHAPAGPVAAPVEQDQEHKPPRGRTSEVSTRSGKSQKTGLSRTRIDSGHAPRRGGKLAACRRWLRQAGESLLQIGAKAELEPR